jgi:TctA family transporter
VLTFETVLQHFENVWLTFENVWRSMLLETLPGMLRDIIPGVDVEQDMFLGVHASEGERERAGVCGQGEDAAGNAGNERRAAAAASACQVLSLLALLVQEMLQGMQGMSVELLRGAR